MKTLRNADRYGQLILAALMILSVPFMFLYGFMAGLFILGCWQLISALLNTYSFIHSGYKRQIYLYWKFCVADLGLLFLSIWLDKFFNPGDMQVITGIALAGSVAIAVFYLKIYFKLIDLIELKNELDGLLKSK